MTMRRRGSSMVEFALAAPVLLLLLSGVLNYALALRAALDVSDAARAGAHYGSMTTGNSGDIAGMEAAARNAVPNLADMTATASRSCTCDGAAASCASGCSGFVGIYVSVTAATTVPNWFRYAGLPFTGAVSSTAVMRAR